ncbi:MAG: membrane protein insertase YidC [Holosporaceae bacterium]|jgi:YidC/Oxa1 family membrane protein insertase|nr:membrane protein insertase YidC [Holosporaceae bacterium]
MEEDKRNLVVFFVISMLIMVGYPYFMGMNNSVDKIVTQSSECKTSKPAEVIPKIPPKSQKIETIKLESTCLIGAISNRGVKIEKVSLKNYADKDKQNVPVLNNDKLNYYAQINWKSDDPNTILPNENTCWKASSLKLSESSPVIFTWDNGNGLYFERQISVDKKYLITIVDKVKNYGPEKVSLTSSALIYRDLEKIPDNSVCYEGPLGYIDGKLEEIKYEDISKSRDIFNGVKTLRLKTHGGWFGLTDKYWLVAFIPSNQKEDYSVDFKHFSETGKESYGMENSEAFLIPSSTEISKTYHLFVGAKEINTLDAYETELNVKHFDLAIDFGCLYILTKPLLYALAYMKNLVGNMGIGILLLTLLIKLLLFPLANKSYRSMNRMSALQPKILELKKKYEGDNLRLGQAVSELYKKEKINPIGGFFLILLQSPVLFALYKVLYISIEMRQSPFIGWIKDLSLPDSAYIFNLFGLIPVELPSFLQIGIWPLLMGLSMWLQQKMSSVSMDASQEKMMLIMPIMFTFMFAQLPSGLVIYWTFSNILGMIQQHVIKKMDVVKNHKKS